MKYTYEELQIMLDETEKAFDVMKKFAEVNNDFLMRKDMLKNKKHIYYMR